MNCTQRRLAREAAEEKQAAAAAEASDGRAYATQMETELGRVQEGAQGLHRTLEQVQPAWLMCPSCCNICVSYPVTYVSLML